MNKNDSKKWEQYSFFGSGIMVGAALTKLIQFESLGFYISIFTFIIITIIASNKLKQKK